MWVHPLDILNNQQQHLMLCKRLQRVCLSSASPSLAPTAAVKKTECCMNAAVLSAKYGTHNHILVLCKNIQYYCSPNTCAEVSPFRGWRGPGCFLFRCSCIEVVLLWKAISISQSMQTLQSTILFSLCLKNFHTLDRARYFCNNSWFPVCPGSTIIGEHKQWDESTHCTQIN